MRQDLTVSSGAPRVYVIHENDAWVEPLRAAFDARGIPFAEWFLDEGVLDLTKAPPQGVFYNRMSASSHTRDHRYAPELTAAVLAWLTRHGRTIVNGERAVALEVSKVAQYESLATFGVETPATLAVVGKQNIAEAAQRLGYPVILKHNRAGKGLGVQLLLSERALEEHLASDAFQPSIDGITLVQRYVRAPQPFITRVEFVGGKFLYAVRVDTSLGFELCPADVCQVGDAFCPVGETAPAALSATAAPRFSIIDGFSHPIVERYARFIADNGIGIAGIEFITDAKGEVYTYDVNTNTNYNPAAEAEAGKHGMRAIAAYLGRELHTLARRNVRAA